jgi:hypothetical protein
VEAASPNIALAVEKVARLVVYRNARGLATFPYDIRVSNAGPDPAPDTVLRDTAPRGVRYVRIVKRPSQGACSILSSGRLLVCRLGDLVRGQSVDVSLIATAGPSAGASVTNIATARCTATTEGLCIAFDSARTRLLAPFAPPPTCDTVAVRPRALTASGNPQTLNVAVRRGTRAVVGATVVASGPGIAVTARTGSRGVAQMTLRPTTSGVLTIRLRGAKMCNAPPRVGIAAAAAGVGPSLTG